MLRLFQTYNLPLVFTASFIIILIAGMGDRSRYNFQSDDARYISYAVSLHYHGVFGLAKPDFRQTVSTPGNANAPVYPMFITAVMALDPAFAADVACAVERGEGNDCPQRFGVFFTLQALLSALSVLFIFLLAHRLSRCNGVAWGAAILALLSGVFVEFTYIFMTEIIIMPLFCALLWGCSYCIGGQKKWYFFVLLGTLLALLTLVRPSYLYLFYGFGAFFILCSLVRGDRRYLWFLSLVVCAFVVVVSPWMLRNKIQLDDWSLTAGGYAEAILIQRVHYNQMTWPEVAVAMIYWLPDFGDTVSKKIFPEPLYQKLGWGEGSYYALQYEQDMIRLSEELGGRDKILPYLITHEMMSLKHIAVSIPLAMRGVFVSKYWGLLGLFAFLYCCYLSWRRGDYRLLLLGLPVLYMVAFHAGLSVSIPRYNLPLVALYAVCLALCAVGISRKIYMKFIRHE